MINQKEKEFFKKLKIRTLILLSLFIIFISSLYIAFLYFTNQDIRIIKLGFYVCMAIYLCTLVLSMYYFDYLIKNNKEYRENILNSYRNKKDNKKDQ